MKLSKKKRKMLKEKEIRRCEAEKRAGIPYSKHKIRTCCHYSVYRAMAIMGFGRTHLFKLKDGNYICGCCGKVFTPEQAQRLEKLCNIMASSSIIYQSEIKKLLTEDILPCKYYYSAPNEITICETENVVPRVRGVLVQYQD